MGSYSPLSRVEVLAKGSHTALAAPLSCLALGQESPGLG